MFRKLLPLLLVVSAAVALTVPVTRSADAITVNTLNLELNCSGVTDLGSSLTADRDNTGTNQEAYTIRGTDMAIPSSSFRIAYRWGLRLRLAAFPGLLLLWLTP